MEPIAALFITFGVVLLAAGWIQLLITSFKDDYTWGLTSLFLPPLSYLYACFSWEKAKDAIILSGIGFALIIFGLLS
ncbi:hypothetical protein TDB9533_01754 [Thalassocella blandensis]|nr:hypothetical protein TDB9533_01754 [Thalassocella blandensis]